MKCNLRISNIFHLSKLFKCIIKSEHNVFDVSFNVNKIYYN